MLRRLLLVVVLLATGLAVAGYSFLRMSLPLLDGERALGGLGAPVTVERDSNGVPTIRGRSRIDVARATGFVHAQDRFFQMDLARRRAAGELSVLFGPATGCATWRRASVQGFRRASVRCWSPTRKA